MSNKTDRPEEEHLTSQERGLPIIHTKIKKKKLLSRLVVLEARIQELILRVRRLESPGEEGE